MGLKNLTPRELANRMKAKGLQKLRWYCQMCQKQCRDENGFKCHCMSEAHMRQMQLFAENPDSFMNDYSRDFERGFLESLSRRHTTNMVHANQAYQEYISDKEHIHMNATIWTTLTAFVMYLGKTGKVHVEETPKGFAIAWINRDPEVLARQAARERKEHSELSDAERMDRFLQQQIEAARKVEEEKGDSAHRTEAAELIRDSDAPLKLGLSLKKSSEEAEGGSSSTSSSSKAPANIFARVASSSSSSSTRGSSSSKQTVTGKRTRELDSLLETQEQLREQRNRKDYWLHEGIVVKVINKSLANGKYYKKKGLVTRVKNHYTGEVEMLDSGDVLRLDQAHLETVVPNFGGKVLIVNGGYRGEHAILEDINQQAFTACLKICQGPFNGKVLSAVEYEDFSKWMGPSP